MVDDQFRARFDEAHAEALRMVAQLDGATGAVNGYPVTPAEIAAFVVARAVAGRRGAVAPAVWRMYGKAAEIAAQLGPLVEQPQASGQVSGRHGVSWSLSGSFLHVADDFRHLSVAAPGFHVGLPAAAPDEDRLLGMYRRWLRWAGVREELVAGATIATRTGWTRFELPMPDARLTAAGEIMNAAHLADVKLDESLATYAMEAVAIQDNHASLSRLADKVQRDADLKAAGVDGLEIGAAYLRSVGHHSTATLKQRVTMHVPVRGLTPGLRPAWGWTTYSSELGLDAITGSGMEAEVDTYLQRRRTLDRAGGLRVEMTGMAVLASRGHDVEAMIEKAREAAFHAVTQGTTEYVSVDEGRIVATAPLSDRVRWSKDHIEVDDALPETLMQALVGRPARSVVDHPALEGAVVSRARRKGRKTHIHLEPRWEIRP